MGYYDDFPGFWTTVVVMNATNWPNPMIPSFSVDKYRLASFYYFMFMVIITEWIFLNLILGLIIVLESSWEQHEEDEEGKEGASSLMAVLGALNPC